MITNTQITDVGKLVKPHGINGEISITTDFDFDLSTVKCIVINIDGINVPFFLQSVRPKGKESYLVTIEGINNEIEASQICGKSLFVLNTDIDDYEEDDNGFYATDLVGYNVLLADRQTYVGKIIDVEDSTENALFIVERDNGEIIYIPIVLEFIVDISTESTTIIMELPIGLLDLN